MRTLRTSDLINRTRQLVLSFSIVFIICFVLIGSPAFAQSKGRFAVSNKIHTRIINGTKLSARNTPLVFIVGRDPSNGGEYICTGELIGSSSVLTASHCVSRNPSNHTVYISGKRYDVKRVRIHPGAKELPDGTINYDVALLILKRASTSPTFSILTSRATQVGDGFAIYGYGEDENGDSERLKYGFMNVGGVDSLFVSANFNGDGSNTCGGDSGGPALFSYYDDAGVLHSGLIAITSAGERSDCGPGDLSTFSNLQNASTLSFLQKYVSDLTFQ